MSGRQTFFAYHSGRKVVTSGEPGEDPEEPTPPAGDADITFQKVIAGTDHGLDGAVYNIYLDGQIEMCIRDRSRGDYAYTIVDLSAPADQCVIDEVTALENVIRVRVIQ